MKIKKEFETIHDAIKYSIEKKIAYKDLIYIAAKHNVCELVYIER